MDILDDKQDATATVAATASAASAKTQAAGESLFGALADEVQSAAPAAAADNLGFGSPHIPTSSASPAPASPLDGAAKLLDFDAKPATPVPAASPPTPTMAPVSPAPVTPATAIPAAAAVAAAVPPSSIMSSTAAAGAAGSSTGENAPNTVDYAKFTEDTFLWVNKVRSVVYLVGGLLALYVLDSLLNSGVALVTGVCWLLLAQVALNFVRGFINPKFQARCTWQDSALVELFLTGVAAASKGAAALHDKHLLAPDAGKALRIVAALWAVSLAGRLVGAMGLAAALWVLAFTLPKVYLLNKSKVDKVVSEAFTQVKAQFVKLDPKARAAIIVVPTFVGGYLLSTADLLIALLALALYGRSLMAQSQVDKVNAAVAPVTTTVTKVGDTVGGLVQSAVAKYELTPTPAKKKRE